jgi:hypothetical protein
MRAEAVRFFGGDLKIARMVRGIVGFSPEALEK